MDFLKTKDKEDFFEVFYKKPKKASRSEFEWDLPITSPSFKTTSYVYFQDEGALKHTTVNLEVSDISYHFDVRLRPLVNRIKEAMKDIMAFEDDWDDDGALATNENTLNKAVKFLHDYSVYILNKFGFILDGPYLDITRDGSISARWKNERAEMMIIFKQNSDTSFYYLREVESGNDANGSVNLAKPAAPYLALWMKELLTQSPFENLRFLTSMKFTDLP